MSQFDSSASATSQQSFNTLLPVHPDPAGSLTKDAKQAGLSSSTFAPLPPSVALTKRNSLQIGPPSPDSVINLYPRTTAAPGSKASSSLTAMSAKLAEPTAISASSSAASTSNTSASVSMSASNPSQNWSSIENLLQNHRKSFGYGGDLSSLPPAPPLVGGGPLSMPPTLQMQRPSFSGGMELLQGRRSSFNPDPMMIYQQYPLLNTRRDSLGVLSLVDPLENATRGTNGDEDFMNQYSNDLDPSAFQGTHPGSTDDLRLLEQRRKSFQMLQNIIEQNTLLDRRSSLSLMAMNPLPSNANMPALTANNFRNLYPPTSTSGAASSSTSSSPPNDYASQRTKRLGTTEHDGLDIQAKKLRTSAPPRSAAAMPYRASSGVTPPTTKRPDKIKRPDSKKQVRTKALSSRFRGVSRCSKDGRWQARIRIGSTVKYLGRFKTQIEAAKCYDVAAVQYHGDRAVLNYNEAGTCNIPGAEAAAEAAAAAAKK